MNIIRRGKVLLIALVLCGIVSCNNYKKLDIKENYIFFLAQNQSLNSITLNSMNAKNKKISSLLQIRDYVTGHIQYFKKEIFIVLPQTSADDNVYKSKIKVYNIESGKTKTININYFAQSILFHENNMIIWGEKNGTAYVQMLNSQKESVMIESFEFEIYAAAVLGDNLYICNSNYKNRAGGLKLYKISLEDFKKQDEYNFGNDHRGTCITAGNSLLYLGTEKGGKGKIFVINENMNIENTYSVPQGVHNIEYGDGSLLIAAVDYEKDEVHFYKLEERFVDISDDGDFLKMFGEITYYEPMKVFITLSGASVFTIDLESGVINEYNTNKLVTGNITYN